ncbi:hypothetical protein [Cerasicoccus frondis]|uniref:hypothetical protein n=1 Tax=Cerasicoccus frondis TaxID=490090 RepID=UPI002852AC17|nr:hypothetical protein [Cerasicoccus frondis]
MNAFYDKIILAVGVLALAGSAAYYTTLKVEASSGANQQPFGEAYEPFQAADFTPSSAHWGEPEAQDADGLELYDVFTPPKIWWDESTKTFIFQPPRGEEQVPPFGLRFAGIERELFRIQLEAYFEGLSGKNKDATVSLFNYQSDQAFRGKVGDQFTEHDVEIVDFVVEKVVTEEGLISRVPRVTIRDGVSGELIVLTTEERLYVPNSFDLTFDTVSPYPAKTIVWEEKGDSETVGDVTWKLLDFDFDKQSATVEKTFADDSPTETKTLTVAKSVSQENMAPTETDDSEESSSSDENSGVFDSIFQN